MHVAQELTEKDPLTGEAPKRVHTHDINPFIERPLFSPDPEDVTREFMDVNPNIRRGPYRAYPAGELMASRADGIEQKQDSVENKEGGAESKMDGVYYGAGLDHSMFAQEHREALEHKWRQQQEYELDHMSMLQRYDALNK